MEFFSSNLDCDFTSISNKQKIHNRLTNELCFIHLQFTLNACSEYKIAAPAIAEHWKLSFNSCQTISQTPLHINF